MPGKKAKKSDAGSAVMRMISRIENQHKCKAIYRVHADRAPELTGDRTKKVFGGSMAYSYVHSRL